MDIKQEQSLKRLLKKLSALRATLKNDERMLLDDLVTNAKADVSAHVFKPASAEAGADEVGAHSLNWKPILPTANSGADEVGAHQLHTTVAHPADANEVGAHQLHTTVAHPADANEVGAHQLHTTVAHPADANEVGAHSMTIVFDQDKEEYRIK